MNKSILLVEDDFLISDLYKIALIKSGFSVDTALDGEQALQKAKQNNYNLILLDIMLPKVTGIEFLKQIRSDESYKSKMSPVIVTSNLGQESIIDTAIKLGAVKYLLKAQVEVDDVVNEVNAVLVQSEEKS